MDPTRFRSRTAGRVVRTAAGFYALAPIVTVAEAQRALAVSNPTARAAVRALVAAGLLAESGERTWRRVYVARPVLDVLRGATPREEGQTSGPGSVGGSDEWTRPCRPCGQPRRGSGSRSREGSHPVRTVRHAALEAQGEQRAADGHGGK